MKHIALYLEYNSGRTDEAALKVSECVVVHTAFFVEHS